uniref:BHLH domain-containing protein n=1 Tax=Rhizophora mucronata TaxID=61149 RepID=A0A2P2LRP8_RHIMU
MELPLHRPFGTEGGGGGRKPTHDFLSLYGPSTKQQDPNPNPPSQSGHLKTHDFLRPLERVGKTAAKEETNEISTVDKSRPLARPASVEHTLPGGIGTYSISHISYFNHIIPKPEGTMFNVAQASSTDNKNEESSNCSSYTAGSGFTLWEESVLEKGKTEKKNVGERSIAVSEATGWMASDRRARSAANNHRNSFSSLSCSQPQKNQSFMEIIKSAKGSTQDDDLDDEEEIVLKKECPSPVYKATEELRIKLDGKTSDQKANTPRSKHSATEQRRRSKINDRFQMLRALIPHSDQKRDKASFLLEVHEILVIEHVQFLQEKVKKYEGSYQGWNQEPTKLVTWVISKLAFICSLAYENEHGNLIYSAFLLHFNRKAGLFCV